MMAVETKNMNQFSSLVRALELRESFSDAAKIYRFGEYRNTILTPELADKIVYKNRKFYKKGQEELISICQEFLKHVSSSKSKGKR